MGCGVVFLEGDVHFYATPSTTENTKLGVTVSPFVLETIFAPNFSPSGCHLTGSIATKAVTFPSDFYSLIVVESVKWLELDLPSCLKQTKHKIETDKIFLKTHNFQDSWQSIVILERQETKEVSQWLSQLDAFRVSKLWGREQNFEWKRWCWELDYQVGIHRIE